MKIIIQDIANSDLEIYLYIIKYTQNPKTMLIFARKNCSKHVEVSKNGRMVVASLVQTNPNSFAPNAKMNFKPDVLETKFFTSIKNARKWAHIKLTDYIHKTPNT